MNDQITRRDVAMGRVGDKTLRDDAVVPASLRINALSLAEAQQRIANTMGRWRPLSRADARAAGYGDDEIAAWFGPEPAAEAVEALVLRP